MGLSDEITKMKPIILSTFVEIYVLISIPQCRHLQKTGASQWTINTTLLLLVRLCLSWSRCLSLWLYGAVWNLWPGRLFRLCGLREDGSTDTRRSSHWPLDKTVVPAETLAETERRKRAFWNGISTGTFLLMPGECRDRLRWQLVHDRVWLLKRLTRNNSARLRKHR